MQQTKKFKMADAISPYLAVSCGLISGLAQDCSNSIANALELLQSWTKPSIWYIQDRMHFPVQLKSQISGSISFQNTVRGHPNETLEVEVMGVLCKFSSKLALYSKFVNAVLYEITCYNKNAQTNWCHVISCQDFVKKCFSECHSWQCLLNFLR